MIFGIVVFLLAQVKTGKNADILSFFYKFKAGTRTLEAKERTCSKLIKKGPDSVAVIEP